jgi:hypothetical protein
MITATASGPRGPIDGALGAVLREEAAFFISALSQRGSSLSMLPGFRPGFDV